MRTIRSNQLRQALDIHKFNLTKDQKDLLNHYIRTPITIINLILEDYKLAEILSYDDLLKVKKEFAEITSALLLFCDEYDNFVEAGDFYD